MSIYDALLANAVEGLKKKPVLTVHFLVSISAGTLILQLIPWYVALLVNPVYLMFLPVLLKVLGYLLYTSINLLLIFTLITTSILVGYYINFWQNLREHIRDNMPTVLDDALKDYTSFIESIMDKTIYDFIRKQIKDVFTGMIVLVLSYYLAWITGLYSVDLMIYNLESSIHLVRIHVREHLSVHRDVPSKSYSRTIY